jgi:hypothetical protein
MSLFRRFEKKPLMAMPQPPSDNIFGMGLPSDVASMISGGGEGDGQNLEQLGDAIQSLFRKKPRVDWEGGGYNKRLEPEPFDIRQLFLRGSI